LEAVPEAPQAAREPAPADGNKLSGRILIDGSSTVFPITEAAAGEFGRKAPGVRVHLGVSGTGGGFKKFCRGETDLSDASRPIKAEEAKRCATAEVRYVEVPIAMDGISVVTHPDNRWSPCITVEELQLLWRPEAEGHILRWDQVRPGWPPRPIALYAPGRDSGTFDYFTHAIVGEEGQSRDDFTGSEDDYLLAQDIAGDPNSLGFFGFSYYLEYQDRLQLVGVDSGEGCRKPDPEAILEGRYRPLSRPIFFYASMRSLDRPEVAAFVDLYLSRARELVTRARYVPLPDTAYALAAERVRRRITGSMFSGGSQVGVSIETLLLLESDSAEASP
jgi:phosphate transport system substrate-binding protein